MGVEEKKIEDPPTPTKKPRKKKHPLDKKTPKSKPIKSLDELSKPSVGDKLLKQLEETPETPKVEDVSTIVPEPIVEESVPETPEIKEEVKPIDYKSYIKNGVEVVDVKAIEKNKKKLNQN